jgi:TolB-like protein
MNTLASSSRRIRSGLFEVDLFSGELYKSGRKVALQEQPFRVLAMLLERPGEVVTREELQTRLWQADTYVGFNEGLNTAIRKLRIAFGDSADNPRFVETLPRRGYRFIGPLGASNIGGEVVRAKRIMLAILPFQNLSNDPSQDYFSDGLTEETITDLGRLSPEKMGVIARTSAMAYKHTDKTVSQIGSELGVDYILEGSVRRESGRVRISAQLIRVSDQTHLWAENYDREMQNVLDVQNELGQAIAQKVNLRLTAQEQSELETSRKVHPAAHDLYWKGLYYWNRLTPTGFSEAINYFQLATKADPNYALAYTGLVDCYAMLPMIGDSPPRQSFPAAQAAAAKALELDDTLAQAHDSAARIALFYEWDWAESEKQSVRAIALNRNLAGAHLRYAHLLSNIGRHQEALAEAERARELDPLSLITNALFGMFLFDARDYNGALYRLQKTIEMNPHFWVGHLQLGKVYEQKRMYPEAVTEFKKARDLSEGNSEAIASLGHAYAVSDKPNAAREVLAELKQRSQQSYIPPPNLALVHTGLSEEDDALDSLERGYEARDVRMVFLKVEPRWDNLRADSRFQSLMRRMRLAP